MNFTLRYISSLYVHQYSELPPTEEDKEGSAAPKKSAGIEQIFGKY
jgi:hypothetical protein